MVIAIVAGGFWLVTSSKPQPAAGNVAETAQPQEMRETPSSRETLSRMGVTWDENNFRSAINRNDTRVALLFCREGWTGSSLDGRGDVG